MFHFVLPPPPPPEDTPSPSSNSSTHRQRSPSLDITSISPPSSQPTNSPPPPPQVPLPTIKLKLPVPPPRIPKTEHAEPQLPNSNHIGKPGKEMSPSKSLAPSASASAIPTPSTKKRKKPDIDSTPSELPPQRPRPEDMPPKPQVTYAHLICRAIKDLDGKATLQQICNWIQSHYEYYKWADGAWMVCNSTLCPPTSLICAARRVP